MKVFKILAAIVFLMIASGASAQYMHGCLPQPQVMNQPPRCYDGRIIPPGAIPVPPSVATQVVPNVTAVGGNPIYYGGGGMPAGGFSKCELVGGLAGGTIGSLAERHRGQAVILGAIIGGVAGNWVCTPRGVQPAGVVVQQPGVIVQSPQVVTVPAAVQPAPAAQAQTPSYRLETSSFNNGKENDDCRLRVNGQVVATVPVPQGTASHREYCDNWQRNEARNRGLIR